MITGAYEKAKKYIDAVICWDLGVIELCRKHTRLFAEQVFKDPVLEEVK